MEKGIPYNTVKRLLKDNIERDLTKESIIYVKNFLDDFIINIGENVEEEYRKECRLRRDFKLPIQNRIHQSILIKVLEKLINDTPDRKSEDIAQYSRETIFSNADVEVV